MEEYLENLNQQQRDAVTYLGGAQLVIAGAGSGKTRVLTHKIMHLLCHGYEPWRIMALTFTNKAAREMRERIGRLVGDDVASRLWMGTFHSIFARILRLNAPRIGFKSSFTIYDTADSKSLVKMIVKDMGLDEKFYKVSSVLSSISAAKNALVGPEAYAAARDVREADKSSNRPETYRIYAAYVKRCHCANAMDFDDLLFNTYLLLKNNPDILAHYQEFFRYILVDEYQDTNYAQHMIVTLLTGTNNNLCVVGDDAQSIYSFRGAVIANILNLEKGYPGLRVFKLEENYRSTQNIIDAANSLIAKNTCQIPKNIFSRNARGEKVEVIKSYSDYEESVIVANRISQLHMTTGDPLSEFAILYRTNAQSRILEESLRKRNIPYRIWGGLSFYQRKEVKDSVAYFRLAVNPNDDEALRRVINTPARGIGETSVGRISHAAIHAGVSMWSVICNPADYETGLKRAALNKIEGFRAVVESMVRFVGNEENNAAACVRFIIDQSRLLAELMSDHTPESVSRRENIQELISGVEEFVESRREQGIEGIGLTDYLADISLATDQDSDDGEADRITLMTVHAAKGLEFNNIIVVGVEDDLFPSMMSKDSFEAVEEERRLLYVAITRARKRCLLTFASSRYRNGQTMLTKPSPFLRDIDSDLLRFVNGSSGDDFDDYELRARTTYHSPVGLGQRPSASADRSSSFRTRVLGQSAPSRTPAASRPAPTVSADAFSTHTLDEITIGMKIEHSRFGMGVVTQKNAQSQVENCIIVDFPDLGEVKTLMLKYAKFKILG